MALLQIESFLPGMKKHGTLLSENPQLLSMRLRYTLIEGGGDNGVTPSQKAQNTYFL